MIVKVPGLRGARMQALLSQAELAERAGITQAALSRLETARASARLSTVRKLARALRVPPSALLSDTSQEESE